MDNLEKIEEKYIATLILHALGDTIGFKNGEWEFNYDMRVVPLNMTLELLYEFISLGGINAINLDGWIVSDDTIMSMAIADGLIENYKNFDNLYDILKKKYLIAYKEMDEAIKLKKNRHAGLTTIKSLDKLSKNKDWRKFPYDPMSGGAGASMRTASIGLAFHGINNRDKLIEVAIESSKMTHNSAIGYLGGLTTALFTTFAIEEIDIDKWPYLLLELIDSDKVRKYCNNENDDEKKDYNEFIKYWKRYLETRFVNNKPVKTKAHSNLIFRIKYQYDNFVKDSKYSTMVGESGYSSTIMAYDSLIDSENVWEKLVIYSMIHIGDSDTVGCIAGAWYGALYGFGDVPKNNLKYLEYKDKLINIGKELFKKYSYSEFN
ncbi:MAG: ADP-ribosylglycohydrolase [Edafosvirus sp.]|uniref:ADP-ribosylglycohydrolase n=1 Tax=Edafosvirus sp. TaxID=2487765 RepID=A0A3G4ZZ40_9VIRU|nr:MAG: ADP-ribosylglycohydrolase [Edafosvirus sp.]